MLKKQIHEIPSNINKESKFINDEGNFILDLNSIKEFSNTELDDISEYTGLFNTQEINLDWSKFENHTFFNSARVKIDVAFNKIINEYPFDGTQQDIILFLESLTGFEKWVFDSIPRSTGSLHFKNDGLPNSQNGVYFEIQEPSGIIFSDLSNKDNIKKILNLDDSFSVQFNIFVPNIINQNQIIFQKQNIQNSKSVGIICYLKQTTNTNYVDLEIILRSLNNLESKVIATIEKGKFNNISFTFNKEKNLLSLFLNGELISNSYQFNSFDTIYSDSNFKIGSGSNWVSDSYNIQFDYLFSGSLDEFKIWKTSIDEIKILDYNKPIFSQENLLVYYKFNEPNVQIASLNSLKRALILDYSGNSLHTFISNLSYFDTYYESIRSFYHQSNIIDQDYYYYNPILFIKHPDILSLKSSLEQSADEYDIANPNLITKLVPNHFLKNDILIKINEDGSEQSITNNTILLTFLYTYAKFFDELKIYLDSFVRLYKIGYDDNKNVPDNFVLNLFKYFGFDDPKLFKNKSINESENEFLLEYNRNKNFNKIKNQILKRVLTSIPEIIKVKGTINSVEMFMRSMGIEPNNQFLIKEYGGSKITKIKEVRDKKSLILNLIKLNQYGDNSYQYIKSQPLTGSFLTFNNLTNFYTANSWCFESLYRLYENYDANSLVRFYSNTLTDSYLLVNVIADKDSITLHVNADSSGSKELELKIENINIFDGNIFHLSFGKDYENKKYFLSVIKQLEGEIFEKYYVDDYFLETSTQSLSPFYDIQTYNTEGIHFEIGNKQDESYKSVYLNKDSNKRICSFSGEVSQIRFWTKKLSTEEINEHALNYESVGVQNVKLTKTFNKELNVGETSLDKFERLLINASCNQDEKTADLSGNLQIFDYSGNEFHLEAYSMLETNNFVTYKNNITKLSSYFDSTTATNKVRVRSYSNIENINDYSRQAPVYSLQSNEIFEDSSNLSIEYSLVQLLNSDIMNIFSSMKEIENIVGNVENLYSYEYQNLNSIREIYFSKLNDKINFKSFYETFKWFDTSLENFISQIIPRKTKFLGVNFIIEQHQLERSKYEHKNIKQYLGKTDYSDLLTKL